MENEELTIANLDVEDPDFEEWDESPTEQNFGTENEPKEWLDGNYEEEEYDSDSDSEEHYNDDESIDVLTALLQSKGINDPDHIKFTDDLGYIQERSWEDLSGEEQYNILNTPQDTSDTDLDDEEVALINQLRLNGVSPKEYAQALYQQGADHMAQQYIESPEYEVDDISDDELFILDLQTRSEDMTDEELLDSLQRAKENPEAYQKQIDGIREEYRQLERDDREQKEAIDNEQLLQLLQAFQSNIINNIDNLNSIGELDIELSDEDKNELAEFILGQDGAGVSYLGKALNDGETLTKMAWFALHGEETLDEIQDYFADQIARARQAGYEAGIAYANNRNYAPNVVVKQPKQNNSRLSAYNRQSITDIDQLDY